MNIYQLQYLLVRSMMVLSSMIYDPRVVRLLSVVFLGMRQSVDKKKKTGWWYKILKYVGSPIIIAEKNPILPIR